MGDRTPSKPVKPGKYCITNRDGSYKYRFGSFRFSQIIPHHIRNHLETTQVQGGNDGVDINHRARTGLDEEQSYEVTVRTVNNLTLLFRILLFYREASLCDSFYDAVGEDLGWPAHIVEETQDIFVQGRQLSILRSKPNKAKLNPIMEFLIDIVDEWTIFRTATGSPRTDIANHWSELRKTWRRMFQANPRSLLFTSPPRPPQVAPTSSPRPTNGKDGSRGTKSVPGQGVNPTARAGDSALASRHDDKKPGSKSGSADDDKFDNVKFASLQSTETEQSQQTESDFGEDQTAYPSSDDSEDSSDHSHDFHRSSSPVQTPEASKERSPSHPAAQSDDTASQDDKLPEHANATASTANKMTQDAVKSDANLTSKPRPLNAAGNGSLPPKPPAALDGGRVSFSSPIMGSSNFPMPAIPPLRATNKPSMISETSPAIRSSPILPSLLLPMAITLASRAANESAAAAAAVDSFDAIFGTASKSSNLSKAADVVSTVNAPIGDSETATSSSSNTIIGTGGMETDRSPVKLPLAADRVKEEPVAKDTKDTKDASPLAKSTTVYKARRTPSESTRRREGARYNAELANRMKKPEVPNFVGALASAAIASALGPRPITDVPVSPSLSNCSAASSPMFVSSHLNKGEEQSDVAAGNKSAGNTGSSAKSDNHNHNPLGIVNVVVPNIEDNPSGRGEIPEQFLLPDYLRIKQDGGTSSPGPVPTKVASTVTPDTSINPGKKHARGSSASVEDGSGKRTPERPRKRVSFGPTSYENPDHQPMTPAQIAQTKRRSSMSISAASTEAHSLLTVSTNQPLAVSPPRAPKLVPSPEKKSAKPTSSPVKAMSSSTNKIPDRLQKPSGATTQSPSKAQKTLTLSQSLLSPVKYKPMASKSSQATAAKAQAATTKLQATTVKSQAPLRKLTLAKSNIDDETKQQPAVSKSLTAPTKTQATLAKRLSSPPLLRPSPPPVSKLAVSAKARNSSPAPTSVPSVLQPRVHGNKDNETVLCDLRVREPISPSPLPQSSSTTFATATTEFSEAERRANQAEAILEFIKAQTAAQLSCLQPLLSAGTNTGTGSSANNSTDDNDMLQCNLQAIRAQLDALSYASRAALDRIKVKQKLQQQLKDQMQGQPLPLHQQQQPQQLQEHEQPHHQPLPQLRDKENDIRESSI